MDSRAYPDALQGTVLRPGQPGQTQVPPVTEGVSRTRNARRLEGGRGGSKGYPSLSSSEKYFSDLRLPSCPVKEDVLVTKS